MNLSLETVFYAANYFDRFVSMNHCNVRSLMMPLICLFSHFSLHILNYLLTEAHIYISNIYDRDGNTGWLNCCLLPAYPLPPSSTIPILLPCLKFR